MKRLALALTASLAVGTFAASANAQAWLGASKGPGFRTGEFEFHPGIGLEVGYDSNYFSRGTNSGLPIVDTVMFRAVPSISVNMVGGERGLGGGEARQLPKVAVSGGASLTYSEYLTNTSQATGLGRNRDFGVNADLFIGIAPGRPWGFNLLDVFARTTQPSLDSGVSPGLNRDDNTVSGELVYTRPGGMFDWRLGYGLGYTYFENQSYSDLTNLRHNIYTRGRWRFLPRTALIYSGSIGFNRYTSTNNRLGDSDPVTSSIGINGLLTDRFSVTAQVGWGATFTHAIPVATPGVPAAPAGSQNFDSVTAQVEARYFLNGAGADPNTVQSAISSVFLGYSRGFTPSYVSSFNSFDKGYVGISATFAQRVTVNVQGAVSSVGYGQVLDQNGQPVRDTTGALLPGSFNDTRIEASAFVEYRFAAWIGLNATGTFINESSPAKPFFGSAAGAVDLNYHRFQVLGGLRIFY